LCNQEVRLFYALLWTCLSSCLFTKPLTSDRYIEYIEYIERERECVCVCVYVYMYVCMEGYLN
jgi:hypothetical protein